MKHAVRLVLMMFVVLALFAQAQPTPQSKPQEQSPVGKLPSGSPETDAVEATMREAGAAFYRQDYVRALRLFSEVLVKTPDNIVALNMSGNCSLQLHDYPSAIERFKLALALRPGEWHNIAGLLEAYSLGGFKKEREQELEYVKRLKSEGKLPKNFSFITDVFDMGLRKVQVMEFYPDLAGKDKYRYWFNIFNPQGQQTYRVTVESNDGDQPLWARKHPKEAAAGQRMFSLDGYSPTSHTTYRFYDGEPPYETVVADVQLILQGKLKGMSASTVSGPRSEEAHPPDNPPAKSK